MAKGKLLGHIITKYGIKIDPNRVEAILKIDIHETRKKCSPLLER